MKIKDPAEAIRQCVEADAALKLALSHLDTARTRLGYAASLLPRSDKQAKELARVFTALGGIYSEVVTLAGDADDIWGDILHTKIAAPLI